MFKLIQFTRRAWVVIRCIPLDLKLSWLNLRYGKGNVPADKLPRILSDDTEGRKVFFQAVELCGLMVKILEHYRIEPQDSYVACMISRYLRMDSESKEERSLVYNLMTRDDRATALLRMVQQNDVPKNKLQFFGPPPPFDSMEAWVESFDNRHLSQPQS